MLWMPRIPQQNTVDLTGFENTIEQSANPAAGTPSSNPLPQASSLSQVNLALALEVSRPPGSAPSSDIIRSSKLKKVHPLPIIPRLNLFTNNKENGTETEADKDVTAITNDVKPVDDKKRYSNFMSTETSHALREYHESKLKNAKNQSKATEPEKCKTIKKPAHFIVKPPTKKRALAALIQGNNKDKEEITPLTDLMPSAKKPLLEGTKNGDYYTFPLEYLKLLEDVKLLPLLSQAEFLHKPIPKHVGNVDFFVEACVSEPFLYPRYLFTFPGFPEIILRCVKKSPLSDMKFAFSLLGEGASFSLGELESNLLGNAFNFYQLTTTSEKEHLISVLFDNKSFPRRTVAVLPIVPENGSRVPYVPKSDQENLLVKCKKNDNESILVLINRQPSWSKQLGALVLERTTPGEIPSIRNLTLMEEDERVDRFVMGKVEKHRFRVGVQWPLSICQGFALAVAAISYRPLD